MNFSKIKIAAVVPVIALSISACGGGSNIASYADLGERAVSLGERIEDTGQFNAASGEFENTTQADALPSGSASYSGISGIWVGDNSDQAMNNMVTNEDTPDVLSELNLTADFDTASISGTMDNFQASTDDVSVSGSIAIENGVILEDASTGEAGMRADLNGQLNVTEAGFEETLTVAGTTGAGFLGDTGEALLGASEGTMSSDIYTGAFVGIWGAERD